MAKAKPKCIGMAWINYGTICRPIYSARQIRRGQHKYKWEVTIRKGRGFKKVLVSTKSITFYQDLDTGTNVN